jgi:hypothetical protein
MVNNHMLLMFSSHMFSYDEKITRYVGKDNSRV